MKKSILHIAITFLSIVNPLLPIVSKAQYTKLLDFNNINGERANGSLISDGTFLYGMTWGGGTSNMGTIFKIKPDGSGYAKLLNFDSTNGSYPIGSLISDGIFLYGMTGGGGIHDEGVVFKIKTDGTAYSNLYNFAISSNWQYMIGGSLFSDGTYLYGMTQFGGTGNEGTIFKLKKDGSEYYKLLDFNGTNGQHPLGSLISDGTFLYGMASSGGTNGKGVIFKIKSNGTDYMKLLDFSGIANGEFPNGDLTFDGTFLYGMTTSGGIYNYGTIFKIKPDGTAYSKLIDFANDTVHGYNPFGGLVSDGQFLYGMTSVGGSNCGVLFKIKQDGTGYVKLMDFSWWTTGCNPFGSVISDGTFLYGMTYAGGINNNGTVFKYCITPVTFTQSPVICAGESIIVGNHTYTTSGRYIDLLISYQGCDSIIVTQLTVNPLPTITSNASATSVCSGTLVTLTGEGATIYTWTGGITNGFIFVPSATTTYTVIGTDTNNCSNTATITINVNPSPQVFAIASDTIVCVGTSVTLTGIGASSYTWTQGITNGIGFVPSYSTTYNVIGTNANTCSDTATINVNVNPLPSITVSASTTSVCVGTTVVFAGAGAVSYAWSGGISDGVGFVPSLTTTYTITGTDANNCSNTATTTINVSPLPDVSTNLSGITISANQNGAVYQWLDCNNDNSSIVGAIDQSYTATQNGVYAVIVSMNGCSDTSKRVVVNTVGINEIVNSTNQLIIFPNPGNGSLTVTLSGVEGQSAKDGVYTIMNESGQQIQLFELNSGNKFSINIEDLSNGIYSIVGFDNDNQMMRQKVVVAK